MKPGTKVRILTLVGQTFERDWSETGKVTRWTAAMGPRDRLPAGYHPVRYDGAGIMMIHESNLMVAND